MIDLEVAAGTPSPTVDPSVRVILIGHSMGGIVAADAFLGISAETPIGGATSSPSASAPDLPTNHTDATAPFPSATTAASATSTSVPAPPRRAAADADADAPSPGFMFPYVQGILAFDTPYLGIAPSVLAYGAESHLQTASSAYSTLSSAASAFGWGSSSNPASTPGTPPFDASRALPAASAASAAAAAAGDDAAAAPAWSRWGRLAMFAGAAGTLAAAGAAAYVHRDALGGAAGWVSQHLAFVGCLMRPEELRARFARLRQACAARGVGFADAYTALGKAASSGGDGSGSTTVAGGFVEIQMGGEGEGQRRTFVNLPARPEWRERFFEEENNKAADEVGAHVSMFLPKDNPGYYRLCDRARERIVGWVDQGWYRGSEKKEKKGKADDDETLAGEEPVLVE